MDKIEFILSKDSQGNPISLNEMSLDSTKSLREILDALIKIVEYEENFDLKIGLRQSSAAESIIGTHAQMEIVYKKIKAASQGNPNRERVYVNNLNIIRNNLENNKFKIVYKSNNVENIITPLFDKKFKTLRSNSEIENNFNIEFFEADLQENGGKKPNFHIISGLENYTIQCSSKADARKVNPFLYQKIYISAWATSKKKGMEYTFCDIYAGDSQKYYQEFKTFFKDLKGKTGTEPFHLISNKLEYFFDNKNYSGARKFIRIFVNKFAIPSYLRTILLISRGFKDDPYFIDILAEVEKCLTQQIGNIK